jgi:zinc transport system ATP-binding protein
VTDHDSLISARGLSLGYNGRIVLRDVNLDVGRGEFWFLLGANGEGKTTFVRTVLGLIPPQAGTLHLDPRRAGRAHIGFVPQRCDLNPNVPTTVREFVLLGLVGIRVSAAEAQTRLTWALEKVGLGGLREHAYWSLSGGQRQRALVARALVRRPQLIILDEPTSGFDPAAEEALFGVLAGMNRDAGLTVLFVTHDVTAAARHATHVALFHGGNVISGPRTAVLTPANLERVYGAALSTLPLHALGGHH